MEFFSTAQWDEALWREINPIYQDAFHHGAKPEKVIRNMFVKKLSQFHVAIEGTHVVAFALTGGIEEAKILLIDYFAVEQNKRRSGIGRELLQYVREWALQQGIYDRLLIEVESEPTSENQGRIHFWQKCGFHLVSDYTQHYIWFPQPYQAMWMDLSTKREIPKGSQLFKLINSFHKKSFQGVQKTI